jgi:predicted ATPase
MATRISSIHIHNYRALADVSLDLGPVGVLFGPNGSGKSTLLDTLWFVRDCAIRGVERASALRSHGIGVLFDGAPEDDQRDSHLKQSGSYELRDPEKLTLSLYLGFNPADEEAGSLDRLLHFVRFYHSRSFFLHRLKTQGSESSPDVRLWDRGDNAWSVLRNLHDRKNRDDRFETIMQFMREAFPSFDDMIIEQTGPNSVYAHFFEKSRSRPILASGVSDGHLQLLLILIALFSEDPDREALILLDEPEVSLHPWALAVLAKAIRQDHRVYQRVA